MIVRLEIWVGEISLCSRFLGNQYGEYIKSMINDQTGVFMHKP